MRLIEIPDDGIIRTPIMLHGQKIGETWAELAERLAEAEEECDALKDLASKQRGLIEDWEKTCKQFRDLFFECHEHPWRNLLRYYTGRPSLEAIWGRENED